MDNYIQQEIRNRIETAVEGMAIDCPECECIGDDQYQCGLCECGGGNGTIRIDKYLSINI